MDNQKLVQLVHETLPQDLTDEDLGALRAAMVSSADVRAALLEELYLEEAIATRLAPELAGRDELIRQLQEIDRQRRHSRWMWLFLCLLLVGAGGLAGALALIDWEGEPPPGAREVAVGDAATDAEADVTSKGQEAALGGGDPRQQDPDDRPGAGQDGQPSPDTVAAEDMPPRDDAFDELAAERLRPDPAWRLFDDRSARGDDSWLGDAGRLVQPVGNATLARDRQQPFLALNGSYRLAPPTPDGQTVRLRLANVKRLQLSFSAGAEEAMIEWADGQVLRGYVGQRKRHPLAEKFPEGIDGKFLRRQVIERLDPQIDFDWSARAVQLEGDDVSREHFAVRWTGRIAVPRDGSYQFITTSDDGIAVYVDGQRIIYNWTDHAAVENQGQIDLKAGVHDLAVEYFQGSGPARARLDWQGPGIDRQVVPADVLRPPVGAGDGSQRGLLGTYCFGPEVKIEDALDMRLAADDGWRWQYYRGGAIDLRYQDGHVLLARGDVVLMALPLSLPPTRVTLDAQCALRLAEVLQLEPLSVPRAALENGRGVTPTGRAGTGDAAGDGAGDGGGPTSARTWTIEPENTAQEVTLVNETDGTVVFRRQQKSQAESKAMTSVSVGAGIEVVMELSDAATDAGIVFDGYQGQQIFVIARQPDGQVLCQNPQDAGNVQQYRRMCGIVGDRFLLRIVYGLGHVRVEISNEGRRWRDLWYQEIDRNAPVPEQVRVGLYLRSGEGPREIRLRKLILGRPAGAIEQLVDKAIVQRAAAVLANIPDRSRAWEMARQTIEAATPKNIDREIWLSACHAAIISQPAPPIFRRAAAMAILQGAIRQNVDCQLVLDALRELPTRAALSAGAEKLTNWPALRGLYDELARREQAAGRTQNLTTVLGTWYRQDFGIGIRGYVPQLVAPHDLVRMRFYDLWAQHDDAALRNALLSYLFLERSGDGAVHEDQSNASTVQLAYWMLNDVRRRLPDTPQFATQAGPGLAGARHPMVAVSDREAANTISEFVSAVRDGQFPYACRLLTQRSLPGGMVTIDADGNLAKDTLVLLRAEIASHPEVPALLRRDYEAAGRLRLRQYVSEGRYEELETLATQFQGTAAAREALLVLGDRDLAIGNFFSAAAHYEAVLAEAGSDAPAEVAAKHRLALAMTGQLVGEPAKGEVRFADRVMPAGDFEQLVRDLVAGRKADAAAAGIAAAVNRIAPKSGRMQVRDGVPISVGKSPQGDQSVAWNLDNRFLAIDTFTHLYLLDRNSPRILWQKEQHRRNNATSPSLPLKPLILADRVIAVYSEKANAAPELACFDAPSGNVVWRQPLGDGVICDPLLIGSWIYVFNLQPSDLQGYVDVVLRRISPASGESLLVERVVQLRSHDTQLYAGRPALAGDSLLIRTSGTLVCCDLVGATRWVRRLPLIPPAVDGALYGNRLQDPIVVAGDTVIVSSAGSPLIQCLDAASGEQRWSRSAPSLRHLIGLAADKAGDKLVYACADCIVALDAATGQVAWQRHTAMQDQSVLVAAGNTLLTITLGGPGTGQPAPAQLPPRQIDWLALDDGHTVNRVEIEQHRERLFDSRALLTDGRRVYGVSNIDPDPNNSFLFWIE